jgi:pyrophosphatase PpaX
MHLLFDLDGTLIDSSDGVVAAVNYSLRMMGEPEQPAERIKPFIGFPLYELYPHFTQAPYAELYRHFQVMAETTVTASAEALPSVDDVLKNLHGRGHRMAIVTTKIRVHLDGIVKKLGWEQYFEPGVAGNEVARPKPDPAAFHLALDQMAARPEDTLVVGDTVNDVFGARAVPMLVAGIRSPYGDERDLLASNPDFFLESITELPGLMTTLAEKRRLRA